MSGFGMSLGKWFRRSDAGIAVPAMDGAFKPNSRLEDADRLLTHSGIDNLAPWRSGLVFSSGDTLFQLSNDDGSSSEELESFAAPITFVATSSDGQLALGIQGEGIRLGQPDNWEHLDVPRELNSCMTAATFLPDGRLAICIGSRANSAEDWKRDLMALGSTGRVIVLDPADGSVQVVADELAYPNGVLGLASGGLAVSESWRHRIIEISPDRQRPPKVILDDLPAYPSRLSPALDDGFWMALFAPRRQLFEMVLREDDYRQEMIATIEPDEWIGPELGVSGGPDQPLQQGSIRQMGVLKPWAPSRSYGLMARCDATAKPLESWHSRADGIMHGITSVCETGGAVYAASRGSGTLLRLSVATPDEGEVA